MNRATRGATSHRAGLAAEEIAARWYTERGAAVLARRWRCPAGEIDLILRDGADIVFVEVKKRGGITTEDPVTPTQWQRLENAANAYIIKAATGDAPVRFDLVLVDGVGAVTVTRNARA
ncbi:MAG: YraN family protein [Pikeienuella sp.]